MIINILLTLLKNGFEMPMFINMLITRLGIISPTLGWIVFSRELKCILFTRIYM